MKRTLTFALVVTAFFFLSGCAAVKVASAAGKAAKAGSAAVKVTKATSTATKAGTAAKVAGSGTAVTVMAHADDAVRFARVADDADAFMLVKADLPKPKGKTDVSPFLPDELDYLSTGLDVADLVSTEWEMGEEYDLGEQGPAGMKDALGRYPSTRAISPAMPVDDKTWAQWVKRPEGDRLCLYEPQKRKIAFLQPQPKQ